MTEPDMTEDRAQLLACFLNPRPTSIADLVGRAADIEKSSAAILGFAAPLKDKHSLVDGKPMPNPGPKLTASQAVDLANLYGRLQAEADKALGEKVLSVARPTGDGTSEDWGAPEGVYVLTKRGAASAWAVLAAIDESEKEEA